MWGGLPILSSLRANLGATPQTGELCATSRREPRALDIGPEEEWPEKTTPRTTAKLVS